MFAICKTLGRQAIRKQIAVKKQLLHFNSVNKIESAIEVSSTQYQVCTDLITQIITFVCVCVQLFMLSFCCVKFIHFRTTLNVCKNLLIN